MIMEVDRLVLVFETATVIGQTDTARHVNGTNGTATGRFLTCVS